VHVVSFEGALCCSCALVLVLEFLCLAPLLLLLLLPLLPPLLLCHADGLDGAWDMLRGQATT